MKFNDIIKFIERYIPAPDKKYPGELGLERMKYLVSLLGDPQFSYPVIHVGGTSGKGSTATIIASILATKYKVGLHTSPHLVKVNERMKILNNFNAPQPLQGKPPLKVRGGEGELTDDISDSQFVELIHEIKPYIQKMESSKYGPPSYFEIVTAMAFLYFMQQKVDMAAIEVGMGGRYDATNVVNPLVAVLTNVGLDHTEVLGSTIEEIAKDKAGIIKPGIQVVSGVNQPSVIKIVEEKCKEMGANLSLLNNQLQIPSPRRSRGRCLDTIRGVSEVFCYRIREITDKGSVFDYLGEQKYKNVKLSLLGKHQVENAVVAIRAIEKLSNQPIIQSTNQLISNKIGEKGIREGLADSYIPGRMEIVSRKPLIILDGAHNGDKAKALTDAIKDIFPKKKVIAVVAIKHDKDAALIIKELIKITDEFIFTQYLITTDVGRTPSYNPVRLAEIAQTISPEKKIFIEKDPQKALDTAKRKAGDDTLILITGSLYLVGEVIKYKQ